MIALSRSLVRAVAAALTLAILRPAPIVSARAEVSDGSELIRALGVEAFAVMRDERLDRPSREARLRALYHTHFDGDGIAAQVLGRAWRQAKPHEQRALAGLIEEYFARLLAGRLAEFARSEFRVLISEPDGDGVVVYSQLAERRQGKYLNLKWRLVRSGAGFKVRDLVVENVSVVLHQKREFAAALPDADTGLDALVRLLRDRIAKLEPRT